MKNNSKLKTQNSKLSLRAKRSNLQQKGLPRVFQTLAMTQKGFTLIELLIVITIIGVLASLLMSNFIGVRQRARDSQRKSDLRQIQSALELWRADQGSYPLDLNFPTCGSPLRYPPEGGATVYMQKMPCDPLNTGEYKYKYTLTSGVYSLAGCLENYNDSQKDATSGSNCTGGTTNWSYTLTPP